MTARKKAKGDGFVACVLKQLPENLIEKAAKTAVSENPTNAPPVHAMASFVTPTPMHIALLTSKYWGKGGVDLGVYFMDTSNAELKNKILAHMNAWNKTANVTFRLASSGMAQVRIARKKNDGYWSYLGTDILHIPVSEPTMNLDSFTLGTEEAEYLRVVRHETGHTLGCQHEHLRKELIARLDPAKTIAYFRNNYGWSESSTRSNVLTPVEDRAIIATPQADEVSIMTYQLPGEITKDGKPIPGGLDIDQIDYAFMGDQYPKAVTPPPGGDRWKIIIEGVGAKPIVATE